MSLNDKWIIQNGIVQTAKDDAQDFANELVYCDGEHSWEVMGYSDDTLKEEYVRTFNWVMKDIRSLTICE